MTDEDLIMIWTDRNRKARLAFLGLGLAFAVLFATGVAARGFADPGSLFLIALAAVLMGLPVALGLGTFAFARGPVLAVLAAIFAIGATTLSAFVMWDVLISTQSTAGIALFLLPMAEVAAFAVVLFVGLLGDAALGTNRKPS